MDFMSDGLINNIKLENKKLQMIVLGKYQLSKWILHVLLEEYNTKRPNESLGNKIPYEWKMNLIKNDYALNKTV